MCEQVIGKASLSVFLAILTPMGNESAKVASTRNDLHQTSPSGTELGAKKGAQHRNGDVASPVAEKKKQATGSKLKTGSHSNHHEHVPPILASTANGHQLGISVSKAPDTDVLEFCGRTTSVAIMLSSVMLFKVAPQSKCNSIGSVGKHTFAITDMQLLEAPAWSSCRTAGVANKPTTTPTQGTTALPRPTNVRPTTPLVAAAVDNLSNISHKSGITGDNVQFPLVGRRCMHVGTIATFLVILPFVKNKEASQYFCLVWVLHHNAMWYET
ncbi:hypothetical protein DFJ77DRAFT_442142 [Powellomyces hirtus]|nr:hypothetical protein DFJ77DRAFT_442142 [Powellomyces hirtus]